MEKIQVELNTVDNLDAEDIEPEPCKFYLHAKTWFLVLAFERVTEIFFISF